MTTSFGTDAPRGHSAATATLRAALRTCGDIGLGALDVAEGKPHRFRPFRARDVDFRARRAMVGVRFAISGLCRKDLQIDEGLQKAPWETLAPLKLRLSFFRPHLLAALQALSGPDFVEIVEFRNRLCTGRQCHPRLLGRRENVNVRRTEIRVVHGADADEPNGGTSLRVVTPNRNPAGRAASNLLTLAARRRRPDEFGLTGRVYDTIGLIESVERMRGAGLTLAPTTMASMNYQWRSNQPISDLSACASAFHVWLHQTRR